MYPSNPDSFGINFVTKGYSTKAAKVKRIDSIGELIGRKIKMFVPGEGKADARSIEIKKLYPFMALGEYTCGAVEKGLISFNSGYPEVIG